MPRGRPKGSKNLPKIDFSQLSEEERKQVMDDEVREEEETVQPIQGGGHGSDPGKVGVPILDGKALVQTIAWKIHESEKAQRPVTVAVMGKETFEAIRKQPEYGDNGICPNIFHLKIKVLNNVSRHLEFE